MNYKLEDSKNIFNGEFVEKTSDNEYRIKIQDNEYIIQILSITPNGMEFVMNNEFHTVKYIENQTSEMKTVVDGVPITINMNSHLDEIVYKNSGGSDTGSVQLNLRSQIPGKIVSINAEDGDEIKKGDVFCVLESMKMQVSVKSQNHSGSSWKNTIGGM